MATAANDIGGSRASMRATLCCPLCFEVYNSPRILSCYHTYCEGCIDALVKDHAEAWAEKKGIQCPICKKWTPAPRKAVSIETWAKDLSKNYALIPGLENDENGTEKPCDPCDAENRISKAEVFCLECREYQCHECAKMHSRFRINKQHTEVKVKDMDSTQISAVNLGQADFCDNHSNKKIKYFCEDHYALCCSSCSHRKCREVTEVKQLGTKIKKDKMPEHLQSKLKTVQDSADDNTLKLSMGVSDIERQSETIKHKLQQIQKRVIKRIETMIKEASDTCDELKELHSKKMKDRIHDSKRLSASIATSRSLLDSVVERGDDAQVLIAFCKMEEQCMHYEETLKREYETLANVELQLDVDDIIHEFIAASVFSTRVNVEKTYPLPLAEYKTELVDLVDVQSMADTETPPLINGCAYLEDGHIVVMDSKSKLCYFLDAANSYNSVADLQLPLIPLDIAVLTEKKIVIALTNNRLQIVSVDKPPQLTTSIVCKRQPVSIARISESELAIGWKNDGVGIIALEDKKEKMYLKQDKAGREIRIENMDYIAVDAGRSRFYQTSRTQDAMFCFGFQGKPIFTYKNDQFESPGGLALDRDGNLCVCNGKSDNIHHVSPEGMLLRTIDVGLENPHTISFNSAGDQMIVVNIWSKLKLCMIRFMWES